MINKIKHFREIIKSNFGRDFGWYIELNNKKIGELIPYKETIFRNSYYLIITDEKYKKKLTINEDSWHSLNLQYKNKVFKNYIIENKDVIGPTILENKKNIILSYRVLSIHMNFKKNNDFIKKIIYKILCLIYAQKR